MSCEIDTIREALEKAIENLIYYDGFDNVQWDKALAALSTIDPEPESSDPDIPLCQRKTFLDHHDEAIRRECAEEVDQLAYEFGLSNEQRGILERKILATEPEKEG